MTPQVSTQSSRPSIVAIGGGHGLTATLGACKLLGANITALVNVADDGGSSGRIRDAFAIAPPGDLRRCLSALVPQESQLEALLEYRFRSGELADHALGNLIFVAAQDLFGGYAAASLAIGEVFGAQGVVLPVSEEALTLHAELVDGATVCGQVDIHNSSGISRVWTEPENPEVSQEVLKSLAEADLIILGPGSLYTSILAATAPRALREGLSAAQGRKVMISNLREQRNETLGMPIGSCVSALLAHGVVPDCVIADDSVLELGELPSGVELLRFDLADPTKNVHDPTRLSLAIATQLVM